MIIFEPLTLSKENVEGRRRNNGRGSMKTWKIPGMHADTMEDSRTEKRNDKNL